MEEKTQKQIEKDFLKSAVQKSTIVEIEIQNPNIWQKILKRYKKKYKVKLVLADIIKISELAMDLPDLTKDFLDELTESKAIKFISENGYKIAEIIGLVLKENPKFIIKNIDTGLMRDIFILMTNLLNVDDFFYSTSLIKNQIAINQETVKE